MPAVTSGSRPYRELVQEWERAYRDYSAAYTVAHESPGVRELAERVSFAARRVAQVWRALARVPGLEHWATASLAAAAEAMTDVAREWAALAGHAGLETAERTAVNVRPVAGSGCRGRPSPVRRARQEGSKSQELEAGRG